MKIAKEVVAGIVLVLLVACIQAAGESEFEVGRKLLQEGREAEAFSAFLKVPGAEHLAVRVARPKAAEFLALLPTVSKSLPASRVQLIEGDLQLALGNKDAALSCYRKVVAKLDARDYPVESPNKDDAGLGNYYFEQPLSAFESGPGSHRDNWLIRRFIALGAWEDAEREFARIWSVHVENTQPYVGVQVADMNASTINRVQVTPCGFDNRALQFALDYAFFLKQRDNTNAALAVLQEPLLIMDMDRLPTGREVPVTPGQQLSLPERKVSGMRHFWPRRALASAGVSRKEFVRLAYGEFKLAGQLGQLDKALERRIAEGQNTPLRVWARIRIHEGKMDEAIALERAYLEIADINLLSSTIRLGQVFEDVGRLAEAAAEYEKALELPFVPTLSLPEEDEEAVQNELMCSMPAQFRFGLEVGHSKSSIHGDLLGRLERLYGSLGKSEQVLKVSLRRLESSEHGMANLATLEQLVARFRTVGKETEVKTWLATRAGMTNTLPQIRANLLWLLGDYEGTIKAVSEDVTSQKEHPKYLATNWKERFRTRGTDLYRHLLQALMEANPQDMQTQLEWLDLQGRLDSPDIIPVFEKLLESDALPAFQHGKGARNRTQFRNYSDLAYRLLRLYERHSGHEEKVLALGFRMLGGEKPFNQPNAAPLASYRANWNNSIYNEAQAMEDTLQALYVFLAHLKKTDDIERAARMIEKSGSIPLINQVNRLRTDQKRPRLDPITGQWLAHEGFTVRTLGLPEGVRLLANRDDVRAIAPGAKWCNELGMAWIGTSWGLVRYQNSAQGLDVLQIPTGVGITTFCETPDGLYVGTRDGLFRLDNRWTAQPKLVRVGIEKADGKQRDRVERTIERSGNTRTDRIHEAFPISGILWWNEALWVASHDNIYRYDPKTKESLSLGKGGLIVGCGKLWGPRSVYNPKTEEFQSIDVSHRQWHIIGATEHEIWADAYVDDKLRHRPAILHPETHAFTVLPISNLQKSEELQNSDFRLLGESKGLVWFAGDNPTLLVTYDRKKKELRRTAGPVPVELMNGAATDISSMLAKAKLSLSGDRGPNFSSLPVGGGMLVGASIVREWQEDNLGYDDNQGMSHHIQDLEGGLFLINPATGAWRKIGTQEEELSDFYVKRCVRDGDRLYVCSNGGVTILSLPEGKIIGRITVSDGLPSNKVEDVARLGDKLYLACELGDDGGGLAVMDLKSGLIQTLSKSDGLKCDKIKRLRTDGTRLHILYGSIFSRRAYGTSLEESVAAPISEEVKKRYTSASPDEDVRTFRSSILDTKTGLLSEGDEILPSATPPELYGEEMPILGGNTLVNNVQVGNLKILAGTHGMLLISSAATTNLVPTVWPQEAVVTVCSARQKQEAEARQRPMPSDITAGLNDPNPLYRTRVAASLLGQRKQAAVSLHIPALIRMLGSPEVRERCTALFLLGIATPTSDILSAYEKLLKDRDPTIRGFAAIQLCKNGRLPDLVIIREVIFRQHEYSNFPFDIDSTIGVAVSRDNLYIALASHASVPIFALVLQSPPSVSDYEPQVALLKQFAASLNRHPEAAEVLLSAHDSPHSNEKVRFVTAVFGCAGTNQLPRLHEALTSKDRVVRSNAARACGAIGEPLSIPLLLKALDMESGLARASIVTALGQLKAKESIPRLTELYIDLQNDEKRRQGGGFMTQQAISFNKAQYESLRTLDTLSDDWNEIKESSRGAPADPREGEELLSLKIIVDAVAKIGPTAARDFYRMLAGGKDVDGRVQAATYLAVGEPADLEENKVILKNLLSDGNDSVQITAAVSLLVCKEEVAKRLLLQWLEGGNPWLCSRVVTELHRVKDNQQLEFARKALDALLANKQQPKEVHQAIKHLLNR